MTRREASIFAAVVDAVVDPEPALPPVAETDAVAAFERWLSAAPPLSRAALRALLYVAELAPRIHERARLRALPRDGRLRALRRLGAPAEALHSVAAGCYWGDAAALRVVTTPGAAPRAPGGVAARGSDRAESDRAESDRAESDRAESDRGRSDRAGSDRAGSDRGRSGRAGSDRARSERRGGGVIRADVCVIGSGAGGAPVAAELAEAGMNVVVLEEGERHPPEAMTARPRDTMPRLYRDAAQTMTVGRPPILLPLGRGVGGTTVVNSGTCFRTPRHVLARWERELGLDGHLDPYFARVERTIGVTRVTEDIAGRNAVLVRRGAERLGWSGGFLERNVRGCEGSGVCAFGCSTGAKQHAGITYMARAERAGATVITGTRARRVLTVRGGAGALRAVGVEADRVRVHADRVVVAAGTIHTPALLKASGLGDRRHLGRHLSLQPATAVWGLFDEVVDMHRGVPQSYYVDEFAGDGIMLETIAGPPDYLAMGIPLAGPAHRELMLHYRHVGQCGLMVSDTSRGRMHLRGRRPLIRYDLGPADVARVKQGVERLQQLLTAAGARSVYTSSKLMAFHPLGTARAHAKRGHGVVDHELKLHGADNVWVGDGSVVPSALGVNPQITIMALATRLAFHLKGAPCPSSSTAPGSTAPAASTPAPASARPPSWERRPLPASGR
jgi:hypothetical protein